MVKGKRVTGFTNEEEEEVQLTKIVPFLVEDELHRLGAVFEKVANWQPFSIVDGRLVTGENPASSTSAGPGASQTVRDVNGSSHSRDNRSASLGDGVLFFKAGFQFFQINGHACLRASGRGAEILQGPCMGALQMGALC